MVFLVDDKVQVQDTILKRLKAVVIVAKKSSEDNHFRYSGHIAIRHKRHLKHTTVVILKN